MTTKDRWVKGEAVTHPDHGWGRVRHVERKTGIAYATTSTAAYVPMGTIQAEHADAQGWRRDTQERLPLFRSSMAAAAMAGASE